MNTDGTEVARLTRDAGADFFPAYSPDGKKIAFASNRDGNREIYVMNADGTEVINLTNNEAQDTTPSWSPDGERIAFCSDRSGQKAIYIMNSDGTEVTSVALRPQPDACPRWSPSGEEIAFISHRNTKLAILVMSTKGSVPKTVALLELVFSGGMFAYPFAWSPDGSKIAYADWKPGTKMNGISIRDKDGSNKTSLWETLVTPVGETRRLTMYISGLAWSPDGEKIAFSSSHDGNQDIYAINADGSTLVNITDNPVVERWPTFSPK
ncbi:MAG: TolB family protein [Candidatus Thorarchaeota archaeon]|jgi:TolB protein